MSDKSADDEHNRKLFEEQVDLVLKAWTEESFDYKRIFGNTLIPMTRVSKAGSWVMSQGN